MVIVGLHVNWPLIPTDLVQYVARYVCQQAPCFKSKFITAELARLFSQSDSEEEFEGFSEDEEEEDDRGCRSKRLKTKV